MTNEKSIFINITNYFCETGNPRVNLWSGWLQHSRNLNLETFIFQLFLQPWIPAPFVRFTPKIEYKLAAERSEANQNSLTFPFWCPRQESNLYLRLRRPPVYPLTYEGRPKKPTVFSVVTRSISSKEIPFVRAIHCATSTMYAGSFRFPR